MTGIKFTQADKDFFAAKRKESKEVDELFTYIRSLAEQFPGTKIVYLKVGESEWGEPSPEGVLPCIQTIPNGKQQKQKATTQNAKRVAITKYKE